MHLHERNFTAVHRTVIGPDPSFRTIRIRYPVRRRLPASPWPGVLTDCGSGQFDDHDFNAVEDGNPNPPARAAHGK